MSDTPLTDAATFDYDLQCEYWVDADFARRLERAMNNNRQIAEKYEARYFSTLAERHELREKLNDWENAAKHVEEDHPDERHCGCVPVLRKLLNDVRKEKDTLKSKNARLYNIAKTAIRYLSQSYLNEFADEIRELRGEIEQLEKIK
jgi:hypothetical protein